MAFVLVYLAIFLMVAPAMGFSIGRAGPQTARLQRCALFAQLGRVTMYKKETCPYCKKARELLEGKYGLAVTYVDVEEPDAAKKEEILQQMRTFSGGRNTVPQIFFNSEHLGGNDDVQKLDADGKLAEKVKMVMEEEAMMQPGWLHPWY